jgi:hypothetical protein
MSRQRRRAIMRRLAKLEARTSRPRSSDEMVDEIIELDGLSKEWREIFVDQLEQRSYLSRAETRLLNHFKENP